MTMNMTSSRFPVHVMPVNRRPVNHNMRNTCPPHQVPTAQPLVFLVMPLKPF